MVGYVARVRVVMAWCELRADFRIFRTDRLTSVDFRDERYPEHPVTLRRRWLAMRKEERASPTRRGSSHIRAATPSS